MAEALTTLAKLLIVREIQEDDNGAILRFHQGGEGRLALLDKNSTYLLLARRSLERLQPVGVIFGKGDAIAELVRADNDVPMQIWEEEPDRVRLLFQGHDGVFHLKFDHPEAALIHASLNEAIRKKARVWFIAQKSDLGLLAISPIQGFPENGG